jgi:hypothetical protein
MTYDHWKSSNPDDEYLGNNPQNTMKMKAGDRVVMTEAALKQKLQGPKNRSTGVIVKITERGLWIRRDGMNHSENWAPDFWMKKAE